MKEIKVVAMTKKECSVLNEAMSTLKDMTKQFEQISKIDDNINGLRDDCYYALDSLKNFISCYESQFIKPKDEE